MQPVDHRLDALCNQPVGQVWSVDQDHRQVQHPGRRQLGIGTAATGILGHDSVDVMGLQQVRIAVSGKGATGDDNRCVRQRQRAIGWINQPEQVMMLGLAGKGRQMYPANRQKHPARRASQRFCRACHIGHLGPAVAGALKPRWPLQRDQGNTGGQGGIDRVVAHPGGKGVGRVDQMSDGVVTQIAHQPFGAAKAAGAGRYWLLARIGDTPGIGQGGGQTGAGAGCGQQACLGSAAQYEDIRHG